LVFNLILPFLPHGHILLLVFLYLRTQAFKSQVVMYTYVPGGLAVSDFSVRSPDSGARYRQSHLWDITGSASVSVTALGCINSVQSPVMLAATSDK